ncbi:helix-turn-helix domain-containing protein [Flammeovirga kamogawensis]|uniref:Helix-turn-helix transcriptional regulator n=1 Tax=Flammeovirga kamogawensis TaxID=373891 RepID=A0ABX8H4F2_9BACT|nr:helix-turn-helix transcriptional regulator [Flammeovirga kamogawensis]MBB6461969.1 transcriptional regulator with XRE-family HTH domain [Flammeovirga kamogawensis]QWG10427.1 helix-turn-helix transcriptional regulator [Flammeovirga kamogawensis]TRX63937.1 helix-turn-helix domain-containing protein [Flammeovirga kamogawensis]
MNYLGTKLRELRESQGLLLRQVAAQIEVDIALISKLERGERRAQREHVTKIASVLNTKEDELITLWLADKLNNVIQDEPLAKTALDLVIINIK